MAHPIDKIKCTHPDHGSAETCEDTAVGCHRYCTCCLGVGAERNWLNDQLAEKSERLKTLEEQLVNCQEYAVESDSGKESLQKLCSELEVVLKAVRHVANQSIGVVGWHKNGGVATWDEVLPELKEIF